MPTFNFQPQKDYRGAGVSILEGQESLQLHISLMTFNLRRAKHPISCQIHDLDLIVLGFQAFLHKLLVKRLLVNIYIYVCIEYITLFFLQWLHV